MVAASEEHYIDRRLVANILVSYFHGQKARPCPCAYKPDAHRSPAPYEADARFSAPTRPASAVPKPRL
jgi:hypothetical protein